MTDRPWLVRTALALVLCALFLGGLVIGTLYRRHRPPPARPRLLVAFLDVGAGDCTLIRTPGGHAILVDAGPAAAGPLIVSTLHRQGVRSLDLLVLAAPTPGSIGGVPALLDGGIAVSQVWENASPDTGPTVQAALLAVRRHRVPSRVARGGDVAAWASARLTALWPPASGTRGRMDALLCRLDYGDTGFLLAGPADPQAVRYLVADDGEALDCDVLQVAAGGADGASPPELLRRATPTVAVISCAPDRAAQSAHPGPTRGGRRGGLADRHPGRDQRLHGRTRPADRDRPSLDRHIE